jgi:hypothetical protein
MHSAQHASKGSLSVHLLVCALLTLSLMAAYLNSTSCQLAVAVVLVLVLAEALCDVQYSGQLQCSNSEHTVYAHNKSVLRPD